MRLPNSWSTGIAPVDEKCGDEKSIDLIQMLLAHTPEPFSRHQFAPGHITATGLVIGPDAESMVMLLHGRLNRWLLPGGHVEPQDEDIFAAAAREVFEETGLEVREGIIIGADVHGIPPKVKNGVVHEPYHQHHDILIGFRTTVTSLRLSEESHELGWVHPREFDQYDVPANIRRAYSRFSATIRRDEQ